MSKMSKGENIKKGMRFFTGCNIGVLWHSKPHFYVHSSMKNAHNLNCVCKRLTVKYHMATCVEFTVSIPNLITVLSYVGIRGQLMETGIHHG